MCYYYPRLPNDLIFVYSSFKLLSLFAATHVKPLSRYLEILPPHIKQISACRNLQNWHLLPKLLSFCDKIPQTLPRVSKYFGSKIQIKSLSFTHWKKKKRKKTTNPAKPQIRISLPNVKYKMGDNLRLGP